MHRRLLRRRDHLMRGSLGRVPVWSGLDAIYISWVLWRYILAYYAESGMWMYIIRSIYILVYSTATYRLAWQALADGTATRAIPRLFDGDAPRPGAGGIFPGM